MNSSLLPSVEEAGMPKSDKANLTAPVPSEINKTALPLSPTMLAARDHAAAHGGSLVRHPGGFWCRDGLMNYADPWFGTPTIEALVKRGIADYTEWKESGRCPFPVRMTLRTALSKATGAQS